ncbi:MAG: carbohydrate kinase family protein [Oscillospiraceae bacterium]
MYDIVSLGELLIDFTPNGTNDLGAKLYAQNPGGAPANVLAMASRLNRKTAFLGKVGQDQFGNFLADVLNQHDINTDGLVFDESVNTTLAFVFLDDKGDRSFSFYRRPGADMMLRPDEVNQNIIQQCKIFHFGAVSLTEAPANTATLEAAAFARKAGKLVSFDPNYRPPLWNYDEARAAAGMREAAKLAHIMKVSEEELLLLTGENDVEKGAELLSAMGPSVILVTLGPKGAFFRTPAASGILPTYDVKVVDTTGAGDAFVGSTLASLCSYPTIEELEALPKAKWEEIMMLANAAGSLATTRKGAIAIMPTMEELQTCMQNVPLLVL